VPAIGNRSDALKPFLQPVWLALGLLCGPVPLCAADYDVIVYGCTSAVVIAAVQAKKMGKSVTPSRLMGNPIAGEDNGYIVLATVLQCQLHKRLTGVLRGSGASQDDPDGRGIDHVR
jgi:hypothetical protein